MFRSPVDRAGVILRSDPCSAIATGERMGRWVNFFEDKKGTTYFRHFLSIVSDPLVN